MTTSMDGSEYFISIVIPVRNGGETLRRCLDSVYASSYKKFECIVVDDHSTDDSIETARAYGTGVIRMDRQGGAARARNTGSEQALGDILLFVDADVELQPDSLDVIARTFMENPGISAMFGSYDDRPGRPNFLSQYKNLFHHFIHQTSNREAST